ncbi:outer membrane beta-barrel protein [Vibrio sp. 10N.261.46.E12]|uniref:outer membrane protein n=2 Tax=Vibrio TaxID=662 RepID=UPI001F52FDA6|nr:MULTISPECIES: outer membrane beta-barrel protein [unclassified Vibrio]
MRTLIVTSICLSMMSFSSLASKGSNYLYTGYQKTRVSDDGFQDYFEGAYNNTGSKQLYGGYLGGNFVATDSLFMGFDSSLATRSSTTLSNLSLHLGAYHPLNDNLELYALGGVSWMKPKRRSSCRNDSIIAPCDRDTTKNYDQGFIGEVGAVVAVNQRWSLQPFYSYTDVYQHGLNSLGIVSSIEVISWLAVDAGYDYTYSKNLKQNTLRLGARFIF